MDQAFGYAQGDHGNPGVDDEDLHRCCKVSAAFTELLLKVRPYLSGKRAVVPELCSAVVN
jgi:hypothetical protein